ncbi:hypothetical protein ACHAXA_002927 [Cyclostephanos tholiformis]|uniref:GIY-YIG domain-containing protein n=1 Tax=Cyclostephanos tholiformis TaxID=382380 RepID=A0ABD3RXW2_9STRA
MCPTRSTNEAMRKGEVEMSSSLPSSTKEDRHTCAHHGHEPKRTNAIANREYKPKKKRRWGRPNRNNVAASATERKGADKVGILGEDHSSTTSSTSDLDTKSSPPNEGSTADRHFHCYLLRSLDPDHPLKTYIGFTTNPQRRIRQHNGILKNAGARRTKVSGRPWTFVCVVHGFQDKITALQFEWAWQNVNKSRTFRDAIGDDKLANKMKRRYGPNARLEELRILLKECLPFCLYSLTVYFPERRYHDVFNGMLKRGKNGNPYKKDDDETPCAHEPLLSIEVCSLEGMPVGREAAILQEKKKARQEAVRIHKRQQKKSTNYESDISDWLKNAKLIAEEGSCWSDSLDDDAKLIAEEGSCWSDSLDDEVGSNCVNIKTIGENNSSIDLNDKRRDSMSSMSLGENDLSRGVFSLRMDAPGEDVPEDPVGSDFSTISSTDSIRSLDDNKRDAAVTKEFHYRSEKENRLKNAQMFDRSANAAPSIGKMGTFVSNSEVVDLCNSP